MNYRIPTLEEIYNVYHRETTYASKGFYPKSIKNFSKVLTDDKVELLTKFQNLIKRNFDLIDWKLYIKGCATYFKGKFDISILGSLKGNKIYRLYVESDKTPQEIHDDILSSIQFIKIFCDENNIKVKDYFINRDSLMPDVLKHISAGSVSAYFYACFTGTELYKIFGDITDDVFFELFNCNKFDFLENNINTKREKIIRIVKLNNIINIINEKFKNIF